MWLSKFEIYLPVFFGIKNYDDFSVFTFETVTRFFSLLCLWFCLCKILQFLLDLITTGNYRRVFSQIKVGVYCFSPTGISNRFVL